MWRRLKPIRANMALTRTDSHWNELILIDLGLIGLYRAKLPIQAKIQRKKKCKMHHLNLITNPKLSHTFFTSNFISLSLVSILSVFALRLPCETLSHSVTHTISLSTHSHTHTLSLSTHSQPHRPTLNSTQVLTLKLNPLSRVSTPVSN